MPTGTTGEGEKQHKIADWWVRYGAYIQGALFVIVFFTLMVRKHDAFHTRALDLAKFDQAIWNTLHGRFLFSSVDDRSILGCHFSPFMALLSPLFLVWPDVRALFLVQTVGLAVAGFVLYKIVNLRRPALAPWFLLAFYMNPALYQVALVEFRRVTLAVPFLALALYGLYVRKRALTAVGLAFALLCKENIALIVFMVGIYLVLFDRDWKWGVPLAAVGISWAVVVTLWVVPAFRPPNDGPSLYPQLDYFGLAGDSYRDVIAQVLSDPGIFVRGMFDLKGLRALWRVFLPVGLVLPFLAADWVLIIVPTIAYMLMSSAPGMHRLEAWYMASVLPGLFASIAVGLNRVSGRWARALTIGLLCTTAIGYVSFSHAPLGGRYEPGTYEVTDHHRLAARAVATIPADARVAAQDPYVPHLSHREHVYLYPWITIGEENIDYLLLDRHAHPYPLQPHEMDAKIDDIIADPSYEVKLEADGIYLFHRGGQPAPSFSVDAIADGSMQLDRVEVATPDKEGWFRAVARQPIELEPGEQVRASLYWEAITAPNAERTVSVRITDASGALVAIYDNLPGRGKKPTSWWQEGWRIRDVYYMTVSPGAKPGAASLSVLVYDTHSQEVIPFDDGTETIEVATIQIVP